MSDAEIEIVRLRAEVARLRAERADAARLRSAVLEILWYGADDAVRWPGGTHCADALKALVDRLEAENAAFRAASKGPDEASPRPAPKPAPPRPPGIDWSNVDADRAAFGGVWGQ